MDTPYLLRALHALILTANPFMRYIITFYTEESKAQKVWSMSLSTYELYHSGC